MKKLLSIFIIMALFILNGYSQEAKEEKKVDKPVRSPWDSDMLIDNQTTLSTDAKTLEFSIHHRFGLTNENGISDLFGLYAPGANIRLGLNYSPIKNLTLGYGITKKNMYNDFQAKYLFIQQTRSGKIPVSVAFFGNLALDGRADDVFGTTYKFSNRLSTFAQVIVSRKFSSWLSISATGSFSHFNMVKETQNHDNIGVGINGQIKFSPQSAILFQYDVPLKIQGISEQPEFNDTNSAKPNFAIGYQAGTGQHAFQVFITTASGILPQDIYLNNHNDFTVGDLMLGFTITRLWGF